MKNCKEKGGRLVKMFSIPHSNGNLLDKFLLLFSFSKTGKPKNTIPMISVQERVKIWLIIRLSYFNKLK